jgi:Arc/MetJ family transcription regulator
MRTSVEIDETLVAEAMEVFGLDTTVAAVEEALRRTVRQARQRQALKELKGIGWEGDLDAMREGRGIKPQG